MSDHANNGSKAAADNVTQLVLTLDRATFTMVISGNVRNLDEALALLEAAHRDTEQKWRAAVASANLKLPDRGLIDFSRHRQ